MIDFLLIDLFCGAGGVTTGAVNAGNTKVIAAVNHDPVAIQSHSANHPDCLHFVEDIRKVNMKKLAAHVEQMRFGFPRAKVILWASTECTQLSRAKGGRPRKADSRTLPFHLIRYIKHLNPDYVKIENVTEFLSWGDLDDNGKPISKNAGKIYVKWVEMMCKAGGYRYDKRIIDSADLGAYTSRRRYFGCFAKPGREIRWPELTHTKKPGMFAQQPHKPVREILDLHDIGNSIFQRKKALVDKTLRRIINGLKKFGREKMIMTMNTPGYCRPIDEPVGTITTKGHKSLVSPILMEYYGNGVCQTVNKPIGVIPTKDRHALLHVHWLDYNYTMEPGGRSIEQPHGALTTNPKSALVSCSWIVNSQYGNQGNSIHRPAPTVVASQKSNPLYLATAIHGNPIALCEGDSPTMIELKNLCAEMGIADIGFRMLNVDELKRIQGFPEDYVLFGKPELQKKHIGNSVVTTVVQRWLEAYKHTA